MSDAGTYTFTAANNSLCTSSKDIELVVNNTPTLSTVTANPVCGSNTTNIVLSGLLANTEATATYTINGGTPLTQSGISTENGDFSFTTPTLSTSNDGTLIEITKIKNVDSLCESYFTGKIVTLLVNPVPTLNFVTTMPICAGNVAHITLTGLLNNTAATATYTINGGTEQTYTGTSTPSGTFTFTTPILNLGHNGWIVDIKKITNVATSCYKSFTGKSVTLVVNPNPSLGTVTTQEINAGSSATIVLTGLVPSSTAVATYKVNGGAPQNQIGTATSNGTFSFITPSLNIGYNNKVVEITKLVDQNSLCKTNFTGKTVTLKVVQPSSMGDNSNGSIGKLLLDENSAFENQNQAKADFIMYPNPVNDILNIQTDLDIQSVDFLNVNGQKVLTSNQKQINVSLLPAGVYIVRVQDKSNNVVIKKVVVK